LSDPSPPARAALVLLVICGAGTIRADPLEGTDAARARQLARILRIEPQIDVIVQATPPTTLEESIAHLRALEEAIIELSRASLTVDATLSRLRHEELEAKNAHDILQSRHDDSVDRWNIGAILIGNGVSIVGSGMQFGNDTVAKAGDAVTIAGSAVAAVFSVVALAKREVGRMPHSIETNMLAPFFDRPATARSRYADWIWRYLDSPLPGAKGSIRQELVEKWTREHRLPSPPAADTRRLDLLTKPIRAAIRRVDADVLDSRADMLADVRERLSSFSVDLELVWREVQARR
jgi:hypothetical protein